MAEKHIPANWSADVATAEVTFAASYDPTEPDNLRTVVKQLRGRMGNVPNLDD